MMKIKSVKGFSPFQFSQGEIIGRDCAQLAKHMEDCEELQGTPWTRKSMLAWDEVQMFCQKRMVTSTGMAAAALIAMSWAWGG